MTLPKGYGNSSFSPPEDLTSDETLQILWQGLVRVDDSIDDYVADISNSNNFKVYRIKDVKYHHEYWDTLDNRRYQLGHLNTVNVLADKPSFDDYMHCAAFIRYELIQREKGLIRKERWTERRANMKGFLLRGVNITSGNPSEQELPILASYRANIGGDNAFDVQQEGIVSLYSSSSSASIYDDPARRSITSVFLASNDKPFIAQVRKKGGMSTVTCNSKGFNDESQDKGAEKRKGKQFAKTKDPLEVLKLRLAKGEITVQEYDELKKVLGSA